MTEVIQTPEVLERALRGALDDLEEVQKKEKRYREALARIQAFSAGVGRASIGRKRNSETAQMLHDNMREINKIAHNALASTDALPPRKPTPFRPRTAPPLPR